MTAEDDQVIVKYLEAILEPAIKLLEDTEESAGRTGVYRLGSCRNHLRDALGDIRAWAAHRKLYPRREAVDEGGKPKGGKGPKEPRKRKGDKPCQR